MTYSLWERFASKLNGVDEAPEPLCGAMQAALKPDDTIRLLILGPAFTSLRKTSSATLLAVLDQEWMVVSGMEKARPQVHRCHFADTLLVEMTNILLFGRLRIDFVAQGRAESVTIDFNTVMEGLYHEAVQFLLNGIDRVLEITPRDGKEIHRALESLPLKFFNALSQFLPTGQQIIGVVHWPAVLGSKLKIFRCELAPEAALALTDRELLFISEEKSRLWVQTDRVQKYGSIVTHCPLSRVDAVYLSEHDLLDTIDVEVHAGGGGEKMKIDFPREQKSEVSALIGQVAKQRAAADTRLGRNSQINNLCPTWRLKRKNRN